VSACCYCSHRVNSITADVWNLESWHEDFEKMHTDDIVKAVLKLE